VAQPPARTPARSGPGDLLAESLAAASGPGAGRASLRDASVAADAVMVTLILSDGNSEPLSLSARPLPADSGPGINECDGSRAAGWAQRGRSRAHWIKIPEEPHKNLISKGQRNVCACRVATGIQ
jgi:hypothetical protein